MMPITSIIRSCTLLSTALKLQKSVSGVQLQQSRSMRVITTRVYRHLYRRSREHEAVEFKPMKRSEQLEWNFRSEIFAFSHRLREKMSEANLKIAFTDKSYVEEERKRRAEVGSDVPFEMSDNRQLAEIGEQFMSAFIKKYLRYFLPKLPEEGILAIAQYLLSESELAAMSKELGTTDLILCQPLKPDEESLATTLKAVVGILVKESGEKHASKFVIDFIITYLQNKHIFEIWNLDDPRKVLQQILVNEGLPAFEPRLVRETGRNTIQACFVIGLYVNQKLIGLGSGEKLEIAEEMAAFDALKRMFEIRPQDFVFKFGSAAYDLNYDDFGRANHAISTWTSVKVKRVDADRLSG